MSPFGYSHAGINLAEALNLAAILDYTLTLKFVHVPNVSRVQRRVDLKHVVVSDPHISSHWFPLLVFLESVYDLDFLFNDAVFTKDDIATLRYDLALGMHHAVLSKLDLTL